MTLWAMWNIQYSYWSQAGTVNIVNYDFMGYVKHTILLMYSAVHLAFVGIRTHNISGVETIKWSKKKDNDLQNTTQKPKE